MNHGRRMSDEKKMVFALMAFWFSSGALASSSKYNPYLLAVEHKTEYTSYLKSLFDGVQQVPVKKVLSKPNIKKDLPGYNFRFEIKLQTSTKQVNFAGEWIIVVIGCGTGCSQYFLVQAETGKIVDPQLTTTNGQPLFVKDRNILVTRGSAEALTLDDAKKGVFGGPKAWQWDGMTFKEMAL